MEQIIPLDLSAICYRTREMATVHWIICRLCSQSVRCRLLVLSPVVTWIATMRVAWAFWSLYARIKHHEEFTETRSWVNDFVNNFYYQTYRQSYPHLSWEHEKALIRRFSRSSRLRCDKSTLLSNPNSIFIRSQGRHFSRRKCEIFLPPHLIIYKSLYSL